MDTQGTKRRLVTVVVAEDEPLQRLNLTDTLADAGFNVLESETAAGALQHLSASPAAALLVTDVRMPGGMDGFALAREAAVLYPAMRIVICSAYNRPQPRQMPDGAVFFGKPYDAELLMRLLCELDSES